MKKNIITVIILAMTLINVILSAVLIFAIVPTANKTNKVVDKVAQIINLELEAPNAEENSVAVSDIETYSFTDKLTINLIDSSDGKHYAIVYPSLSINKKHKDYAKLNPLIPQYENEIKEIITDEFGKYTIDNVKQSKDAIKEQILKRVQELFQSDFIINVSFGNSLFE